MPKLKPLNGKNRFSQETIKRLSLYLRNLKQMKERGISTVSSNEIVELLNVTPVQFRKDLSYFGGFGKRGVGYDVERLAKEIENILGMNKQWRIALVGVGKLGSALLGFEGFSRFNVEIACAFDIDTDRVGKIKKGVKISDVRRLKTQVKKQRIKIAIIATPPDAAQEVTDKLIRAGVKGILNFAPLSLKVPDGVRVSNVDMACELESLIFFAEKKC